MLFNSIDFAVFLPTVFLLYWFVFQRNLAVQNAFLVAVSYLFYGWWDWRFLSLIAFSSLVDHLIGQRLAIAQKKRSRKLLLLTSITINLGFLGFFKYFNFFAQSFADAFTLLGGHFEPTRLEVILPVGISFYTFQTLSYTIDVYRRKLEPCRDPVSFFAFVSFFPQLVAGPIERATNLLPQFYGQRNFDYAKAVAGMRQILWGLFKKVVIADNAAVFANDIFANYPEYSGSTLLVGAVFFAFQIYCDFSGYSDIAIGTAKLFGFNLMRNFAFPYFSRDMAEFWRRWHISLSTWFRDYIYIPLGGSQLGKWMNMRNVMVIFLVSGFWHGANWTFLAWGFINAMYFIPLLLLKRNRRNTDSVAQNGVLPDLKELFQMATTFLLTTLAWVFFRAPTITDAWLYLEQVFSPSLFTYPEVHPKLMVILILILVLFEWLHRKRQHGLDFELNAVPRPIRWFVYFGIIFMTVVFGAEQQEFIYFQF